MGLYQRDVNSIKNSLCKKTRTAAQHSSQEFWHLQRGEKVGKVLIQFKYSTAFESMSQLHYPTKEGNLPTSTILTDNRFNSSNQNQDLNENGTSEVTTIVIAVSVCIGFIIIVVVAVIVIKRRRRESRQLGQHESFPLSDNR